MKKIIVDRQYQLPEFPSVPYTPSNFWKTMRNIEGIEVIVGEEPAKPTKRNDYGTQDYYRGIFHIHPLGVTVDYNYKPSPGEATVILYGLADFLRTAEKTIRETHRTKSE